MLAVRWLLPEVTQSFKIVGDENFLPKSNSAETSWFHDALYLLPSCPISMLLCNALIIIIINRTVIDQESNKERKLF